MISKHCFTLNWLQELKQKVGRRTDPKLFEKVIHALALLERIQAKGFQLIFKGGTSLLLMTEEPVRFSIDIDIVTARSKEELEKVLDEISTEPPFHRWEGDNDRRSSPKAPVAHYKFYYNGAVDGNEEPILLDVLFKKNPYPAIRQIEISHPWLIQEGEALSVTVPTYEAILGDKLTAFAPKTTGILYTKIRPVEIIKQLFDISFLYDRSKDFQVIKSSFIEIAKEEIGYRGLEISWEDVLEDTFQACLELSRRNEQSPDFQQLSLGLRNITNFIISNFRIDEAITAGAKVAYLTSYLQTDLSAAPVRFEDRAQITELEIITPEYQKLNRLRKTNPEAFFYWYNALKLRGAV